MNAKGDYIGLIPAAGLARRLGLDGVSKEVMPLSGVRHPRLARERIAIDCLLDGLRLAGIERVHIVIREGKWDVPARLGDGADHGLALAYHLMGQPWGTPFSLDQVFRFVKDRHVALGFPDIQFAPRDAFAALIDRHRRGSADIVIGLFPTSCPDKFDMVRVDSALRVVGFDIKPAGTDLVYSWIVAAWSPRFSVFMHDFLAAVARNGDLSTRPEIYVGTVFQAALRAGIHIEAEIFPTGKALDLGTRDDLALAADFYHCR